MSITIYESCNMCFENSRDGTGVMFWKLCNSNGKYYAYPSPDSDGYRITDLQNAIDNKTYKFTIPDCSELNSLNCLSDYGYDASCDSCLNMIPDANKNCSTQESYTSPWTNPTEYSTLKSTWKNQQSFSL
jgi:hypothetical protein